MAEESTALSIVETQQDIVGSAMVGAAGTGVLAEAPTDSTTQILEQIRDIQVKTLRGISDIGKTMREIFDLDKLQDRRAKEDQTELDKEKLTPDGTGADVGGQVSPQDADKASGGIFGFFGALPGAGMIKKLFAPILAFFGKGGLLVKLFGRFGPLGALILGFTLIYKYSDEISKALAPALDKIKVLFDKLQPAIDVLMQIGDFLMKGIIEGIGEAISFLLGTVEKFIDGITKIFEGDIMGGLNDIFEGIVRTILAVPLTIINFLKPLFLDIIDYIAEPWNNMVTNVNQYISDTFTAIKDYFVELKDKIVGFFVEAYETVKTTITDAVQGAFNFIADIFNSISDFMSSAYTKAKNFVTSLPDKILGFIANMFSPIIDFFNAIGNRIKTTINGVIESLPLPGFVKDKIKFDVEPTQDQLDEETNKSFEKLEAPDVGNVSLDDAYFAAIDKNKDAIMKFMEETGTRLDLKGSRFHTENRGEPTLRFEESDGTATIFSAKSFDDGPSDEIKIVKGYQASKIAASESATMNEDDLYDEGMNNNGSIMYTTNNYNTNNSSVANQTDVHSGSLDTGIDTYHDKLATATG